MKFKTGYFLTAILFISLIAQAPVAQNPKLSAIKQTVSASDASRMARLETLLENLWQELKIPALSAAIVKDQKVAWAKGFGFADVENKIPATKHTPYQSFGSLFYCAKERESAQKQKTFKMNFDFTLNGSHERL